MAITNFLCVIFVVATLSDVEASAALRGELVNRDVVKQRFLTEFKAFVGQAGSNERLQKLEESIRPIYAALPKPSEDGVDQGLAQYILQRHLRQRHGWHMRGMDKGSVGGSETSSSSLAKSEAPALLFELLDQQMGGRSIGVQELAVVAATVEDLVFGESMDVLSEVQRRLDGHGNEELTALAFLMFVSLADMADFAVDEQTVNKALRVMPQIFPGWDDLALWIRDVNASLHFRNEALRNPFAPDAARGNQSGGGDLAGLVESVAVAFGRVQNLECMALKNQLMDMGQDGTVALADFYSSFVNTGAIHFVESKEYLRAVGALDESDPARLRVRVSNYMNSDANCLTTSGFVSVCCINECEELMSSLEASVSAPAAAPELLAELVSELRSDTVAAPRTLAPQLVERLGEIASYHRGQVPLHGRLFAQWMHYAFPLECPHPVNASSAAAQDSMGRAASEEEMLEIVNGGHVLNATEASEPRLHWWQEDALPGCLQALDLEAQESQLPSAARWAARFVAFAAVLLASAAAVAQKLRCLGKVASGPLLPSVCGPHVNRFV